MDFDELLAGVDDRRETIAVGRTRRAPPMSARSRDSVRFNDNLANSLANELMMANNSALVDIQLEKDEDQDYEKLLQ